MKLLLAALDVVAEVGVRLDALLEPTVEFVLLLLKLFEHDELAVQGELLHLGNLQLVLDVSLLAAHGAEGGVERCDRLSALGDEVRALVLQPGVNSRVLSLLKGRSRRRRGERLARVSLSLGLGRQGVLIVGVVLAR